MLWVVFLPKPHKEQQLSEFSLDIVKVYPMCRNVAKFYVDHVLFEVVGGWEFFFLGLTSCFVFHDFYINKII